MLNGLFIASIMSSCYQVIKDAFTPTISAEQWGNKELIYKDIMEGNSDKLIKNAQNGKYIVTEKYLEPHRNPRTGQIMIENGALYEDDVEKYGAYQAYKWAQQGRYNLTPEELEKENKRIDDFYKSLCKFKK